MPNSQGERRTTITISDEDMEVIAKRAAKHALNEVYAEVGRTVVKKIFWLMVIGAVVAVLTVKSQRILEWLMK